MSSFIIDSTILQPYDTLLLLSCRDARGRDPDRSFGASLGQSRLRILAILTIHTTCTVMQKKIETKAKKE